MRPFSRSVSTMWIPYERQSIYSVIRKGSFISKRTQKSRTKSKDGSRFLGLLWKGKSHVLMRLPETGLDICTGHN